MYLNLKQVKLGARGRQLVNLLAKSPEIETCILEINRGSSTLHVPSGHVLLPHLETLRLWGHLEVVLALTRLLSQPSLRLYVDPLPDRAYSQDSVSEVHRAVAAFWQSVAHEEALPATRIQWREGASCLVFGADFDADARPTRPCVFLRAPAGSMAGLHAYAPLQTFDTVDFISTPFVNWPYPIDWGHGTPPLPLRELCPAVCRVLVKEMTYSEHLVPEFAAWARERADAVEPLDVVELRGCGTGLNKLGRTLEEDGIVRKVIHTSSRWSS